MADDSILVQPSTSTANECMSEEKNLEIQAYDNSQCYCYLDDCNGILHGIPNSFDLGTIPVRLTCISVSTSYMAIGSSCGALFLFNRRLNKNVNPLRTSFKEVVTCIELFASKQDDFLALGHRSGTVILLCLPSRNPNGNRKIKQSIQEDGHKGQSIARMAWNENGTKLYTSDLNGLIMVTEVDFSAEVYNCLFVHNESRPIVQLISQNNFLAFCTTEKIFIFNSNNNHIIFEASNFSCDIQDIFIFQNCIAVLDSHGKMYLHNETSNILEDFYELDKLSQTAQKPHNFVVNGRIIAENNEHAWTLEDFPLARVNYSSQNRSQIVFSSSEKIMIGDFGTKEPECFVYDLERFLDDPNFEILDLDCDVNSNEIFILTSTKRLLRLSKSPAKVSLIYPEETSPNGLNLFSSFTEAAHRSTNMFEKFKKTDEFERLKQFNFRKFGIPSQLSNVTEQLKGTIDLKNTPNIEQTGKTLASNLFSFIDNIKSSALATELPQSAQNLFSSQFASSPSSQSSSPPSRIFETNNQLIDVPESSSSRENSQAENEFLEKLENHQTSQTADVSVNRKKKTAMKKKFLPKVVENVEEITVAGNSSITNENVIEEENMEKCLRLLGMINEPEETKQEIDDTGVLRTETSGEILIDQVEETSSVLENFNYTGYSFQAEETTETRLSSCSENFSADEQEPTITCDEIFNSAIEESDLECVINKTYNQIKQEDRERVDKKKEDLEINFLEDAEIVLDPLASDSNQGMIVDHRSPEYDRILSLGNYQTDIWNRMQLPFEIGTFDVSSSYIVITSKKSKTNPHFLPFNNIDSGIPGGEWVPINSSATSYAVNDSGNLLWRIEKGIAYSPLQVNTKSPNAIEWVEQASQGTVLSVSISSQHAWYLTNKGVFVQMNLPEMGILFHADCPFPLSCLAASDHAVWGIRAGVGTLVVRVGLEKCPMGYDWVEDCLAGPRRFVSIALYKKSGWALDPNGVLWFNNCVQEMTPFGVGDWFQVCAPMFLSSPDAKKFLPISKWQLKVCSAGVFLYVGKIILVARQPLTGHRFPYAVPERMSVHDNFSLIASGAFTSSSEDHICVSQPNSEIFLYSIHRKNFTTIPGFTKNLTITALAATGDHLYVLDSKGKVHFRNGLSNLSSVGNFWEEFPSENFDEDLEILSITVSKAMIWIITNDGSIWARNSNGASNWKRIDRPKVPINEQIDEIRTSPSGNYVWIYSKTSGRAWARIGISENDSKGRGWSEASTEIKIIDLAVGDNVIWALSSSNRLYRLRCLSEANPVGLLWKPIPVQLKAISIDEYENRLWGLDMKNRIVRHEMDIYPRSCLTTNRIASTSLALLKNSQNEQEPQLCPLSNDEESNRERSQESDVSEASWNDVYELNRTISL